MKTGLKQWAVLAAALALIITGCGSPSTTEPAEDDPSAGADTAEPSTGDSSTESEPEEEPAAPEPRTQEETCDWDSPALELGSAAPASQEGDIATVIIGSWQHTHFDAGAGYEPVTNDIRYVFPSVETLLYCQHVPGITDHAENSAMVTLNGTSIDLPNGAPGYEISAWSDDAMVWVNRMDDSLYLLQRR